MGAVGTVAGGALLSGAASVAGLALATRWLGTDRVGPLAVAWTLAVVVGPGLWSSVEQEAARATARGEGTAAVSGLVVRRALVAAAVVATAGLVVRHRLFGGSTVVPVALAAIAAAYGPLHLAWGRLAGERRSSALALSIAVEGLARLLLVGGTVSVTHAVGPSAVALAAAVASAAVVATATARVGERPNRAPTATDDLALSDDLVRGDGLADDKFTSPATGDLAVDDLAVGQGGTAARVKALTWAGLLSQGLFLTSPAIFELLTPAGDSRTARLAMAVVLARAPALAWKGVLAAVVPAVAAETPGSRGERAAPASVARAVLAGTLVAAAVGTVVAMAIGDRVLDVLTGPGPHLGPAALALLAVATAAFLGALTATSALAGSGRARAAASSWAVGVVVAGAAVMVPGDPLRRVVTSLATGTAVALAGTVRACLSQNPDGTA